MKILWFLAFLHAALAQASFGRSYLGGTKLCQQWSCLNTKLGLPDALPDKNHFQAVLNSLLPEGPWQNVAKNAVDTCYRHTPRIYTSTCPGQGLLFCAVDHLIKNCPEDSLRKYDACAPLTSLAGFRYLFTQSRYQNLERNLPTEKRPAWFLKNYFSSKCCNLPDIFNSSVLNECGFTALITYYDHPPRPARPAYPMVYTPAPPSKTDANANKLNIVDISAFNVESSTVTMASATTKVKGSEYAGYESIDPLDCCDMDEFIQPTWRSECDFHLNWSIPTRLGVQNVTRPATETTAQKPKVNDVKVVPLSCEKETCVFTKLGVMTDTGSIDIDAFSKLLDNVTDFHPDWSKAKARAVTTCLARPVRDYTEVCEINKVLACTMDVLSENCPHAKKTDPCKRSKLSQDGITCQISASKSRPKNRRLFCGIPNLVNHKVLSECRINSISRMEYVPVTEPPKKRNWFNTPCQQPEPTKCILNKMGALNKYGFMDYFKMKDRIRNFSSQEEWAALTDVYLNAFSAQPMYYGYCHTSKKLLNVVDFMLSTCPIPNRRHTHQCNKIFTEMATTSPVTINSNKNQFTQVWRHLQHVFMPHRSGDFPNFQRNMHKHTVQPNSVRNTTKKNNIVDVYQNFFDSNSAPSVKTMAIRPQVISRKPLVLFPVYLRANGKGTGSLSIRPYKDGVMRRDPFELHNKIVAAHTTSTTEDNSDAASTTEDDSDAASTTEDNSDVIDPK